MKMNLVKENVILATSSEAQLYFLWNKLAFKKLYTETWAFKLEETIDLFRLSEAIKLVLNSNPELQTSFFMDNGIVKKVLKYRQPAIFIESNRTESIELFIEKLKSYSFHLENEPLIQFYIWSNKENKKYLLINSHHILTDAWTKNLLIDRVMRHYYNNNAEEQKKTEKNPSKPKLISDEKITKFEAYCKKLEQVQNRINSYQSNQELHTGFVQTFELDQASIGQITRFCTENRISVFSFYLGCFYSFICTYSGEKKISIGIPYANRQSAEEQQSLGYFVNTLPFGMEQEINEMVTDQVEYYRKIQRNIFEVSAFQRISLSEALKGTNRDSTLFHTVFSYQESQAFEGVQEEINTSQLGAKFELTGNVKKNGERVFCELEFSDEVWTLEESDYFTEAFKFWLQKAIHTDLEELVKSPLPCRNEKILLGAENEADSFNNIFERFLDVNRKKGDNAALIHNNEIYTYKELLAKIMLFSSALEQLEVNEHDFISLQLKRSPEAIALILALVKKGICHVHLSQHYPADRIEYILSDSRTTLLITDDNTSLFSACIKIPVYTIENLVAAGKKELTSYQNIEFTPSKQFAIIYTSGTTGNPKGVKITHENILNFSSNFKNLGFTESDIFSQSSSFTFDAWYFEVWLPILNGACIYIIPDPITDKNNWDFNSEKYKPTISFLTTSLFNSFVENGVIRNFTNANKIFIGGEAASVKYVKRAQKLLDKTMIYNCYGPTENTTFTTVYPITLIPNDTIALGLPLNNVRIGVLGSGGQLLPVNCLGEVVISGKSLMDGYFRQPELTSEKLVVLNTDRGPQMFYKTGDIGKIGLDNYLHYKSRKDRQVKIRGFRVELSEIEAKVLQIEGVHKCVVSFTKDGLKRKLTLYYEGICERELLRKEIDDVLPAYMVPNEIVQVAQIRLTVNGKLDKESIEILGNQVSTVVEIKEWSPIETIIGRSIEEIMGTQKLSNTDNFYELGIDSIVSMQICASIQSAGLQVSVSDLFSYQTIQALADYLTKQQKEEAEEPVLTIWKENKLSPIQEWFFDSQPEAPSQWNQSVVIKLSADISTKTIISALKQLIDEYIIFHSVFREVQGEWRQIIQLEQQNYFIEWFEAEDNVAVEAIIAEQQKNLRIEEKNYQFSIIQTGSEICVHLVAHHLIIDGVSWRNILNKLSYKLNGREEAIETRTFNQWINYLDTYEVSEHSKRYWNDCNVSRKIDLFGAVGDLREESCTFTKAETQKFKEIIHNKFYNDVEAALLGITVHALTDVYKEKKTFTVQMEGHGRPVDQSGFSTAIGWFTSIYPFSVSKETEVDHTIAKLHTQLLSIPNKGLDYPMLKPLNFFSDWTFNYMGEFNSNNYKDFDIISLFRADDFGVDTNSIYHLSIVPIISDGQLEVRISYDSKSYGSETITKMVTTFKMLIKEFVEEQHPVFLPACSLQKGMLLQNIKHPDSGDYVIQWQISVDELDINRLQQAISKLVASSEALRSSFMMIEGEAVQIIRSITEILSCSAIQVLDWSNIPVREGNERVAKYLESQRFIPFNSLKGPLFRFHLMKMNDGYVLIFENHHLILDGWSMSYLFNRLSEFYENPSLTINSIERYSLLKKNIENEKKYLNLENWWQVLADYSPVELLDMRNTSEKNNTVVRKSIHGLTGVYDYLKKNRLTMNQFFLLVWSITISQLFGKEDVLFGVTNSGRNSFKEKDFETIGMFISTLPFRIKKLDCVTDVEELIDQVRENTLRIQEFDRISWLDLAEYFAESPEIQIGYVFENYPIYTNSGKFSMQNFQGREQIEFPLALSVTEADDRIDYELHAKTNYFSEDMLKSATLLIEQIAYLLQGQGGYPEIISKLHGNLEIYPPVKAQSSSQKEFSKEIESHLKRYSKRTYIRSSNRNMTYRETLTLVVQLIQTTGLSNDDTVVVLTEDRLKKTIYALACFISGAVYVPVSKEFNTERIQYIIENSSATCMFTEEGAFTRLCSPQRNNSFAYIIYTSGTTGKPKGVIATKINIQNALEAMLEVNLVNSSDVLYQNISMTFDPSIMDILLPLYTGASIYIPDKRLYGVEMEKVLRDENITAITITPSLIRVLELNDVPSLKTIMIGGEKLRYSDIKHIPEKVLIYNLYGPTETTIVASMFKIDSTMRTLDQVYSIGQTLNQLNGYCISKSGIALPLGMPGELVLEGSMVSAGYTDRALTNKVFDFNENTVEKNRYYTGDICYISRTQLIHYIGRKDRQVKLRGYRVELNEIEQSIARVPGINNFQLLINDETTTLLLAYIGEKPEELVTHELNKLLPSYMVPSIIRKTAQFPLLANGKIDHRALHDLLKVKIEDRIKDTVNKSQLFCDVMGIWQEVLALSYISEEDNFFELGGNSLTAIQVIRKINEKTEKSATIQQLFKAKSFGSFIKEIEEENK
ncbi:condensation domain-containing protein [Paenibacillus sp. OK003]|uniref:condensation domain-containing protein n=1 Tax=Paenibacillus sp. OK003 TaxID=1884380 RepID=UPI0008D3F028|nr:condensation domain-containing protein [Paenibacillus sp. OK003]SEL32691.1 non-ribosomal peptide synthase domain TIGR01720/amino acid adenylation domain-containing protein [Paenibacillus sp. OK003]